MKKLLCVVPALLVIAMIGASNARADSYTVTFACDTASTGPCPFGVPPTSTDASFPGGNFSVTVPDPSTSTSAVFDVTLPAAFAPTDSYGWAFSSSAGGGSVTDALEIVDQTSRLAEFYYVTGTTENLPVYCEQCIDGGSVTFSPASAATPEPAPVLLMLLGVGLMFLMRKRFAFGAERTAQTF